MDDTKEYIQRQPIEIILKSKRGTNIADLDGHKFFELEKEIIANKGELILLHLKKSFIPFSFYCLSSSQKNNILDFKETSGANTTTASITIPDGNYTITDLLKELTTLMNTATAYNFVYKFTYIKSTNKINVIIFTPSTGTIKTEFLFSSGSNANNSCRRILGFDATDVEFTYSAKLVSTNVVDMADGLDSLHIKSNLIGDNIQSTIGAINGSELLIIPVNLSPPAILYFQEDNPFRHKLSVSSFKVIEIHFTDNNNNTLDFNQIPYTLILLAEFIKDPSETFTATTKTISQGGNNIVKNEEDNIELYKLMVQRMKITNEEDKGMGIIKDKDEDKIKNKKKI